MPGADLQQYLPADLIQKPVRQNLIGGWGGFLGSRVLRAQLIGVMHAKGVSARVCHGPLDQFVSTYVFNK